jgi:hypothetical protein
MKLTRGQTVTFSKNIKDSAGREPALTSPVTGRIMDPAQNMVLQGTAARNLDTGLYDFQFTVPTNAPYSTVENSWTMDWSFPGVDGTVDIVTEFDVVEDDEELPPRTSRFLPLSSILDKHRGGGLIQWS